VVFLLAKGEKGKSLSTFILWALNVGGGGSRILRGRKGKGRLFSFSLTITVVGSRGVKRREEKKPSFSQRWKGEERRKRGRQTGLRSIPCTEEKKKERKKGTSVN